MHVHCAGVGARVYIFVLLRKAQCEAIRRLNVVLAAADPQNRAKAELPDRDLAARRCHDHIVPEACASSRGTHATPAADPERMVSAARFLASLVLFEPPPCETNEASHRGAAAATRSRICLLYKAFPLFH